MKKYLFVVLCLLSLGLPPLDQMCLVQAEIIDKIVAIIGDDIILLSEVQEWAAKPVVQAVAALGNAENIEQATLQYMLERQLLAQEIRYLAVPREKDAVRILALEYIARTYHQRNMQTFEEQLRAYGVTEADLEQELTVYMKAVDYIRRKYRFSEDIENPDVVLNLLQTWVKELQEQTDIQILL